MRAMEAARRTLDPALFLEIKYETFCEQPMDVCRRVLEFAELPPSPDFERDVAATSLRNMSDRWRDDLTVRQQHILDELLREDLQRYGYDASSRREKVPETVGH
jgi:hypothetical protein